ncbi:hypothetical protein pb186bvf_020052 [Paramecium bursaria]
MLSLLLVSFVLAQESEELQANKLAQEKLKKEYDTIYYTCIMLARIHLGNYGDELLDLIRNQTTNEEQSNVWKKLYTGHAQTCSQIINYDESVQILAQIRQEQFDYNRISSLFSGFDFESYKLGQWNREISEVEYNIWKYIEEFESAMAENQQKQKKKEQEQEYEDLDYLKLALETQKPQLPLNNTIYKAGWSDIIFLIVAFGTILVSLLFVYRKLSSPQDVKKKKK